MKRVLASALVFGVFSLFSMSGCGDSMEKKETVSDEGGKTTTSTKVESTGSNPPANAEGETGKSPAPPK